MNYAPSTPVRERLRSYVANDIVGAVYIRIDGGSVRRPIQHALHPPSTEGGYRYRAVDRQRIGIEEAGRAGVALLGDEHSDAHQLRLVGQQLDEASMGHAPNVLIAPPAQVRPLFPERILADAERPDALSDE